MKQFRHFPLHFSRRFVTPLDSDLCSPEEKASATIGSHLNYAKYRIFSAILEVRQFLLWQSLPHSLTGRSCQTPPSFFAQENERLERKNIMENAFQLQGWNIEANEVLSETHFTWNRWETFLFSSRC